MAESDQDLLFSLDEIREITNTTLPDGPAGSLAVLATDAVRDYCGWRVAKAAEETVTITGTGTMTAWLPTLHIVSITSVIEDGDELTERDQFDWDTFGVLDRVGGRWKKRRRSITVAMEHGYEKCPGGIAQAIGAAVARGSLVPASGVTSETTLSAAIQYSRAATGAAAGSIFLPHELVALDRHRIPESR